MFNYDTRGLIRLNEICREKHLVASVSLAFRPYSEKERAWEVTVASTFGTVRNFLGKTPREAIGDAIKHYEKL